MEGKCFLCSSFFHLRCPRLAGCRGRLPGGRTSTLGLPPPASPWRCPCGGGVGLLLEKRHSRPAASKGALGSRMLVSGPGQRGARGPQRCRPRTVRLQRGAVIPGTMTVVGQVDPSPSQATGRTGCALVSGFQACVFASLVSSLTFLPALCPLRSPLPIFI